MSRMCNGMLRFAMMCTKAGISRKGSSSRLNSCMCKDASNLLVLLNFCQLVFITFLMHQNLAVSSVATSGWLVRKEKFISVYC